MRLDDGSDWPYRLIAAMQLATSEAPLDEPPPDVWHRNDVRRLTRRERDVLVCASRGMSAKMTAAALELAVETVRTYRAGARTALGAKTTTHACCEAIRRELIP